jgi:hypothetical protein
MPRVAKYRSIAAGRRMLSEALIGGAFRLLASGAVFEDAVPG